MVCLMAVVYIAPATNDWPVDRRPSLKALGHASLHAAVPMVVPFVILFGFIFGVITATEAGAGGRGLRGRRRQALLSQRLVARHGQDRLRLRRSSPRRSCSCSRSRRCINT
jgi:hypothetical protein